MTSPLVLPPGETLVDVERSGVVESVHRGHVVILDAAGRVTFSLGSTTVPMFPRSCNKPMQALGLLAAGAELTQPQLALAAASHSGEPMHVDVARSTLADGGIEEAELGCPPDLPLSTEAARDLLARGGGPAPIYMNCSGKHAAMLATCRRRDWSRADYLDPAHPLQLQLAATVAESVGETIAAIGTDGCGAPLFAFSLVALARGFLRLADPENPVGKAMRARPDLVGGTGRRSTALMNAVTGLVAKEGAEGVYAAALPGVGAVALKIDDGAQRAADVAVVAALRRLGVDPAELDELSTIAVLGAGRRVGSVRPRPGVL